MENPKQGLGLSRSGGEARALAHIGVLNKLPVDIAARAALPEIRAPAGVRPAWEHTRLGELSGFSRGFQSPKAVIRGRDITSRRCGDEPHLPNWGR